LYTLVYITENLDSCLEILILLLENVDSYL
jgi:hypothetical protein